MQSTSVMACKFIRLQLRITGILHARLAPEKFEYFTYRIPEDRTIKVVLRGVLLAVDLDDMSIYQIKHLKSLRFIV